MKTNGSLVAATAALVLAVLGSMACGGGSDAPDPPDARPRVDALPVVCGDGIKVASEQCDDGNTMDGDGCSATCLNETEAFCGNGVREAGEECDDGNLIAGDGCSAVCAIEMTGPRCGNGVREGSETCSANSCRSSTV